MLDAVEIDQGQFVVGTLLLDCLLVQSGAAHVCRERVCAWAVGGFRLRVQGSGYASQSTLFRQRLQSVLDRLAARVTRKSVAVLTQTVQDHMRRNQSKLSLCCHDLSEEQQAELIAVFNEDWNIARDSDSSLVHWCPPGCCPDERKTKLRAREILEASMSSLFECPLLYRWKYFEPALAYCL